MTDLTIRKYFILLAWGLFFTLLFLFTYEQLSFFAAPSWISIGLLHTFLVLVVLTFKKIGLIKFSHFTAVEDIVMMSDRKNQVLWTLVPGIIIFLTVLILGLTSQNERHLNPISEPLWQILAICLWIPCVEEILFRGAIGSFMRQRGGLFWGSFFSALIFSSLHGIRSLQELGTLSFYLPLGPLLLGLICEFLYLKSRTLLAPYFFHVACNMTVYMFTMLDKRWLEYLRTLYLKN